MVEIATSLLSLDTENVTKDIYNLEVAHTDYIHIDVMDGKFVEKDTEKRMFDYTNQIKAISNIPIDVHFMVEDIKKQLEMYIPFMPNCITFHYEACKNKEEVFHYINKIKEEEIKVGIAISPKTKLETIYEFLPFIHMVLMMTVEPGKGGQQLIPETLEKIKLLYDYRNEKKLEFNIEADGGINLETIGSIKQVGVDIAVVGSAITKSSDYKQTIELLKS
ncbi:MAG: ribulose-phosphate 3-epimerase [Clostridia bacterium]|nr:ribulose-phosphate 3-epimerase [Clostridia bacterium]